MPQRLQRYDTPGAAFGVLGVFVLLAAWSILDKGQGLIFFYDEWEFVSGRSGHSLDTLLTPHNEHPSLFPLLVYKTLLETAGLGHYWIFRLAHVVGMQTLAVLVYLYGRPRIGRWWALLPAIALTVVGSVPDYVLQTFELSFTLSLVGVVGAFIALDHRRDAIASLLLVMAVFSSGVGLTLLPAIAVELALREDRRQRARVLIAPLLLYALWWPFYHSSRGHHFDSLSHVPRFMEGEYTFAVSALTTLGSLAAPVALVLAAVVVAGAIGQLGRRPRFWALVLAPLTFWAATALARYGETPPETQRYAYPGAVLLAMLICELGAGRRRPVASARLIGVVAAGVAVLTLSNTGLLSSAETPVPEYSRILRPELTALELARPTVDPEFRPDALRAPDITARGYFDALDRYPGSAADSVAGVRAAQPDARAQADGVLLDALRIAAVPVPRPPPGCRPAGAQVDLSGTLFVDNRHGTAQATIAVRRFADAPGRQLAAVAPGAVVRVSLPSAAAGAYPLRVTIVDGRGYAICTTP
jgi:hypothetical protein